MKKGCLCYNIKINNTEHTEVFMQHNLVSYNQLAGSYEDPHDQKLTEYYECLIESGDDHHSKRICSEVLLM